MASTSPTDGPESPDVTITTTPDLSYDFSRAFPSHGPSDLIVRTTNGEQFHVHKKVEANTGIVDMSNDPPAAVATLLHFLYTDKYEHKIYKDENGSYTLECLFHLDGYITGVIHSLPLLQQHCGDAFKRLSWVSVQ
ncbi:hypothetical protein BKA81DRAFT_402487 [Phyllosticta paracitricarpa]|uniref:BTB domain-containing protein n=1 Tax=Phyllosticta paracitricarpa TaxID=2016321 RepID=A0ABR1NI20_9PEZI